MGAKLEFYSCSCLEFSTFSTGSRVFQCHIPLEALRARRRGMAFAVVGFAGIWPSLTSSVACDLRT